MCLICPGPEGNNHYTQDHENMKNALLNIAPSPSGDGAELIPRNVAGSIPAGAIRDQGQKVTTLPCHGKRVGALPTGPV